MKTNWQLPRWMMSSIGPKMLYRLISIMNECYPFDLCYFKCRFSTDRIKQGDLMFNVYYLQNKVFLYRSKNGIKNVDVCSDFTLFLSCQNTRGGEGYQPLPSEGKRRSQLRKRYLYKLLLLPRWKMGLILQYNHVYLQVNS